MSNAEKSTQWTSAIGGKLPTRDALLIALQQQHGHISSLEIERDQAVDVADKKVKSSLRRKNESNSWKSI